MLSLSFNCYSHVVVDLRVTEQKQNDELLYWFIAIIHENDIFRWPSGVCKFVCHDREFASKLQESLRYFGVSQVFEISEIVEQLNTNHQLDLLKWLS